MFGRLGVATSASKVSTAFIALAPLHGKQVQPVTGAAKAVHEILDPKGLEVFNGLQRRCKHASCDFWQLLWGEDAAAWQDCIKESFAAGMSLELEEATVKYQGLPNRSSNWAHRQLLEHQWTAGSCHCTNNSLCYHCHCQRYCVARLHQCKYSPQNSPACSIQLSCMRTRALSLRHNGLPELAYFLLVQLVYEYRCCSTGSNARGFFRL